MVPTDLSSEEQCARIVERACEQFGGVDVFVQNGHHDGDWTEVADAAIADWRHIMDVNFFGAFAISQRAVPSMTQRGGGRIVLVNTGAIYSNPARLGAYAASKAALASLARTMAVELGHSGILVNSVTLGPVQGENTTRAIAPQGTSGRGTRAARRGEGAGAAARAHAHARRVRRRGAVPGVTAGGGDHGPEHRRERRPVGDRMTRRDA